MRKYLIIILCSFFSSATFANEFIEVGTKNTSLLFKVDDAKRLQQVYYGKKISDQEELKKAPLKNFKSYSTFGTTHVFEAALRAVHFDGNTSTELSYLSSKKEVNGNIIHTMISMKDDHYDFFVDIHYNAYQSEDMLEQWVEIRNAEKKKVTLHNFASSDLSFDAQKYFVTHFHGDWSDEMNMAEQELTAGIKTIDSKLGVRTNQFTHPCFLLSVDRPAEEGFGEVIGGTLAWPGSFQLTFEVNNNNNLRVLSGINPYASDYHLEKDEIFTTPKFLFSYSDSGKGEITRRFHRWARQYGIRHGNDTRDILLNNWEATYFDFDEQKLTEIIDDASKMGFELFLLDDGWFGNKYPRNADNAGLGDWQTNKKKLPNGIPYLINECKKRGLKFGIWVEPEMVNPKSELYEKHPDWIISQPFRERTEQRNQLILDMSNPKVKEFVFNTVDKILQDNPGIDYVKWDANRYVFNSGSSYLPADKQSHLWIDNSNALLEVMNRVSTKYPDITFMLCSGGGGRIDYGSMKNFDEYWISDNNDPLQRIFTQWGAQHFFPTVGLASHVSVSPNHISGRSTPLKYRFDIAMAAKLGMDLQPVQMNEQEKVFSRNAIQTYKEIRNTVLHGDLYRILSPYKNNRTVFMYVNENKDEAIVFNFLVRKNIKSDTQTIYLKGLDSKKQYTVKEINKEADWSRSAEYEGKAFSGEYLMTVGMTFPIYNEYESVVLQINAI